MKKIIFLTVMLLSMHTFSQKIKILDAETRKPVSYAKLILKEKDYYKNAEENGETSLKPDEEISEIQSFGYENFKVEKFQTVYLLRQKFAEIQEVEISRPKLQKSFKIGSIKNNSVGFSASTTSWMVVNLFKADDYKEKLYIKKIRIPTNVIKTIKEATFNLVFYGNNDGKPSKEKVNSLVVTCKSGKNITEIDLTKTLIQLPENGYFIGFEWIINEQNKYTYVTDVHHPDGRIEKNVLMQGISPKLSGYEKDDSNVFFNTGNLNWHKMLYDKKITKKNYSLSIQLELTN